jgi:hypothetical protein
MEPVAVEPGSPEAKMRELLWGKVGRPSFVIIGEPVNGKPVHRVSTGEWGDYPRWPVEESDPGPAVGWLLWQTVEEARRDAGINTTYTDGAGVTQVATELPTEVGDRRTWSVQFPPSNSLESGEGGLRPVLDAVALQNIGCELGRAMGLTKIVSYDLDFTDVTGSRKTMRRRLLAICPTFERLLGLVAQGELTSEEAVDAYMREISTV